MSRKQDAPTHYESFDRPCTVGTGRKVAYALAVLGLDVVQRSTVRALLPQGTTKQRGLEGKQRARRLGQRPSKSRNKTSLAFQEALQGFERSGWITRGTALILVRDRGALLDFALYGETEVPPELLDIGAALQSIRAEHAAAARAPHDALLEQRRRELEALTRLMQAPAPGGNHAGTGSVRIVHRSRLL